MLREEFVDWKDGGKYLILYADKDELCRLDNNSLAPRHRTKWNQAKEVIFVEGDYSRHLKSVPFPPQLF